MKTTIRTKERIYYHYQVERKLAEQLRKASFEERKRLYSALYDELFNKVPELVNRDHNKNKKRIEREMRTVQRYINPETVFLEIGSGDCLFSIALAGFVKKVISIDVSKSIPKQIKEPENFYLIITDGCSYPALHNNINVAYSNQLIEHLHPDDAIIHLKEVFNVLLPGGLYLCLTPNRLSGPHDISRSFDKEATGFHLHEYTNIELVNMFKSVGFSDITTYIGFNGYYVSCPQGIVILLEKLVSMLPYAIRKLARGTPLNNIFICGKKRL